MRFSRRRELTIGLAAYGSYWLARRAVLTERGRARAQRNGERILALERRLGLDAEIPVQRWLLRRRRLVHALNVGYALFNVSLTAGLLHRLHRRENADYYRLRRACVSAFVAPIPVYLFFPTAPARRLPGFVDTIADVSRVDLESPFLVRFYNPIAAMPSIHCAFAVVTALSLARRTRSLAESAGALAYPPLVALVVISTANHYVLDTIAGAALGLAADRLTR